MHKAEIGQKVALLVIAALWAVSPVAALAQASGTIGQGGALPVKPQIVRGQHLANTALTLVGKPYVWGGVSAKTGMDCSGLIVVVLGQWRIKAEHSVIEQFKMGVPVGRHELQPGDLVFFKDTYKQGLSHVGVYVGNEQFVNAGDEQAGVMLSVFGPEGEKHYAGARRLDLSKLPPMRGEAPYIRPSAQKPAHIAQSAGNGRRASSSASPPLASRGGGN